MHGIDVKSSFKNIIIKIRSAFRGAQKIYDNHTNK